MKRHSIVRILLIPIGLSALLLLYPGNNQTPYADAPQTTSSPSLVAQSASELFAQLNSPEVAIPVGIAFFLDSASDVVHFDVDQTDSPEQQAFLTWLLSEYELFVDVQHVDGELQTT